VRKIILNTDGTYVLPFVLLALEVMTIPHCDVTLNNLEGTEDNNTYTAPHVSQGHPSMPVEHLRLLLSRCHNPLACQEDGNWLVHGPRDAPTTTRNGLENTHVCASSNLIV